MLFRFFRYASAALRAMPRFALRYENSAFSLYADDDDCRFTPDDVADMSPLMLLRPPRRC